MPVEKVSGCAIQEVLKSLAKIKNNIENGNNLDTVFLKGVMDSPIVQSLAKVHDTLEKAQCSTFFDNIAELMSQVVIELEGLKNDQAEELCKLLKSPHVRYVATAHDDIAKHCSLVRKQANVKFDDSMESDNWETPVRMVGLTKRASESLGVTVAVENNEIVVTRIFHGGLIYKQGLLHVGDIVREVNGHNVEGNPDMLKRYLNESVGSITLKIIPSNQATQSGGNVFLKCNFSYNPNTDPHIPSQEAGLSFQQNDILKVVNREDVRWWQAHHVNNKGEPIRRAGLIPSLELQERRQIITKHSPSKNKKVERKMYRLSDYYREYSDDFMLYEEVALLPPFTRKCVLLVSHDSSVAYHVRERLVVTYPNLYKAPVVNTTSSGARSDFAFVSRDAMLKEIKENKFFEFSEVKNDLYGTKYDAVRNVIKSGKTCVKDVLLKNLKFLMTSEFMPYVIFLKPDNDIAESPAQCINSVLSHRDPDQSCQAVHRRLVEIAKLYQWVPVSWVF